MRAVCSRTILVAVLSLTAVALGACSREKSLKCASGADYVEAETAGRLRIPDDLSVPDETDSLRIPSPAPPPEDAVDEDASRGQTCLEESPAFSKG